MVKFIKNIFLLLLVSVILYSSCKKSKRPNWIAMNIMVLNKDTNKGIKAEVVLAYKDSQGWGSSEESVGIGTTNDNGYLYFERKVKQNQSGFMLKIYPDAYTLTGAVGLASASIGVSPNINDQVIYVDPYYRVRLKVINDNCVSANDTLIYSYFNHLHENNLVVDTVVGCGEQIINPSNSLFSYLVGNPTTTIYAHSIKGGIVDEFEIEYNLSTTTLNHLTLHY